VSQAFIADCEKAEVMVQMGQLRPSGGSVPIVGVTTAFARRGLQPARASAASPGTGCILHHGHHAALPSLSSMAAAT